MRPAVYASVMRTRKPGPRRVKPTSHEFSWKRLSMMLLVGVVLFLPGLVVTIIGIESAHRIDEMPGDTVLYKYIGPAALACGILSIVASGLYYCCWGFQSPVKGKRVRKHKKSKGPSDQYDPLQAKNSKSNSSSNSGSSNHSGSRHKSVTGQNSVTISPDQRSSRHGNNSQRYRTSSRSSLDSQRSHQQYSRNRQTSQSRYSNHSYNSHIPNVVSSPEPVPTSNKRTNNEVTFSQTGAPLAQGENLGSMDISIAIDTDIEEDKRY